jgi:hypothetical protein
VIAKVSNVTRPNFKKPNAKKKKREPLRCYAFHWTTALHTIPVNTPMFKATPVFETAVSWPIRRCDLEDTRPDGLQARKIGILVEFAMRTEHELRLHFTMDTASRKWQRCLIFNVNDKECFNCALPCRQYGRKILCISTSILQPPQPITSTSPGKQEVSVTFTQDM